MRLGHCLTATFVFAAAPLVGQNAGLWRYTFAGMLYVKTADTEIVAFKP